MTALQPYNSHISTDPRQSLDVSSHARAPLSNTNQHGHPLEGRAAPLDLTQKTSIPKIISSGLAALHVVSEVIKESSRDIAQEQFSLESLKSSITHCSRLEYITSAMCRPEILDQYDADTWAEKAIKHHNISTKNNSALKIIALRLPVDKIDYYVALQTKIAQILPRESNRPTIDLKIKGESANPQSIGILGGVGPLSDAHLLQSVIAKAQAQNPSLEKINIHLFSSTPPRRADEVFRNALGYAAPASAFLTIPPHQSIYMASNTAHVNFDKLSAAGKGNLVNLAEHVTEVLDQKKQQTPDFNVLVLGTSQASRAGLYPNLLQERQIPYTAPEEDIQEVFQQEIDKTKQGKLTDQGELLYETIVKLLDDADKRGQPITHILLGCTELPLALKERTSELQQRVEIIDTEEVFSDKIAADLTASF